MGFLVLLVTTVVFLALLARARHERAARRVAAATMDLIIDDWGVKRWLADGRYEEVGWDELQEVRAITLPKGPWPNRLRFVLDGGGERGCIIDVDNAEESGLLERLAGLPGFDHRKMADVIDNIRTGTEQLWSRTTT